jgi:hypothetical protein
VARQKGQLATQKNPPPPPSVPFSPRRIGVMAALASLLLAPMFIALAFRFRKSPKRD